MRMHIDQSRHQRLSSTVDDRTTPAFGDGQAGADLGNEVSLDQHLPMGQRVGYTVEDIGILEEDRVDGRIFVGIAVLDRNVFRHLE